jgi:ATP-dependent exoDNAse (exonuclease V) alpha subunit
MVIGEAIERVTGASSTWLRADLARELATLVPADAAPSGEALVALVDDLAERAARRCVELHPRASADAPRRRDGRPISEHVVDRRLTTPPVLAQERRLLDWAEAAIGHPGPYDDPQAAAAAAVAGTDRLVLVVGPAGTGKTTTLQHAAEQLRARQRPMLGLAPSGKGADVLAHYTGAPAMTLAKLLTSRDPGAFATAGTTLVLDEAGMAATDDLDRLVALAARHHWRLACIGDPAQLPAVGRGGMFAHWCRTFPAIHLETVHRFTEAWEPEASLQLRAGDPSALDAYAAHRRLHAAHPAVLAEAVARQHRQLADHGRRVAITTSTALLARRINQSIQHRSGSWRTGPSIRLRDGTHVHVGDRIATRRNDPQLCTDQGQPVRNRQTWTVAAIAADGTITAVQQDGGSIDLPRHYVTRHVELGWAVTGYGNQGDTVDHGIAVIEPGTSRAGLYVAMTRGRTSNHAWVPDPTGTDDPAETLSAIVERPPTADTAHAIRERLHAAAGTPLEAPHSTQQLAPPAGPEL